MATSIERQFINEYANKFPNIRLERLSDKNSKTHHITFRDVLNEYTILETLKDLGFKSILPSDRLHSSKYLNGKKITYKGKSLYFVVRNGKSRKGNHTIVQKQTAPEKFKLGGTKWDKASKLKQHIINNFPVIEDQARDALLSLLNVLDGSATKFVNTGILENDKSYITSDFGEIIGAYYHLLNGAVVEFPLSSNETNIDYYVNGVGIAHKSINGSSRVVLADNKDKINNLDINTGAYRVLKAIANRDKFGIFSNATGPVMSYWRNKLTEFSEKSFNLYINSHTYNQFISDVKASQASKKGKKLGIPNKAIEAEQLWNEGSHHPLMFTLLTLTARCYSETDTQRIGDVICALDEDIIFDYVDYDVISNTVTLERKQGYTRWKLRYHGNYASAFNNWPAAEGIE